MLYPNLLSTSETVALKAGASYRRATCSMPAAPSAWRSPASATRLASVSASAEGSSTGTSSPVTPSSTTSCNASTRLASRVDALQEVVLEGVTGLLVPVDDPSALADTLASLVADAGLRHALGAAGMEHVARRYDAPAFRATVSLVLNRLG